MDLHRLPFGEMADMTKDCITIVYQPDGRFQLQGAALDEEESVSFGSASPYGTVDEAEAAGLAWAEELGVKTLYIAQVADDALK